MRLLQVNKYASLNGGSETVVETISRLADAHRIPNQLVGFTKTGQVPLSNSSPLGPERLKFSDIFWNPSLIDKVVGIAVKFRPDVILHHNIYHHFPMHTLVEALDRRLGVPQSIVLHDLKAVCPTYLGMRDGNPCTACSGGRYWNAVRYRCKSGSVLQSAALAIDSAWNAGFLDTYSRFHKVICPSRFLASNLRTMGLDRELEVLQNPCPPIEDHHPQGSGIVFAGRLSVEKGITELLRCAESLPNAPITIIGDGPLRRQVEVARDSLGNIRYLGKVPREAVLDSISSARFTIIPSICQENSPMVALESLSRGIPLLGSSRGGIPELVGDSRGLTFDPSVPGALKTTIERAISMDEHSWSAMSRACIEWATTNQENAYWEKLEQLIN